MTSRRASCSVVNLVTQPQQNYGKLDTSAVGFTADLLMSRIQNISSASTSALRSAWVVSHDDLLNLENGIGRRWPDTPLGVAVPEAGVSVWR